MDNNNNKRRRRNRQLFCPNVWGVILKFFGWKLSVRIETTCKTIRSVLRTDWLWKFYYQSEYPLSFFMNTGVENKFRERFQTVYHDMKKGFQVFELLIEAQGSLFENRDKTYVDTKVSAFVSEDGFIELLSKYWLLEDSHYYARRFGENKELAMLILNCLPPSRSLEFLPWFFKGVLTDDEDFCFEVLKRTGSREDIQDFSERIRQNKQFLKRIDQDLFTNLK